MKKYVDGKYIEMTAEEIEKLKEFDTAVEPEPTMLERLEAVEAAILEGVLAGD